MSSTTVVPTEPFPWPRPPIDPPKAYAVLRAESPVTRVLSVAGEPIWLVSRYDDVRAVLAHPACSSDMLDPGFPWMGVPPMSAEQRMFLRMDPPDHTVFRKLLAPHFLVKRIEALRPRIRELVDATLHRMLAANDRRADLVTALALPVPSTVLTWVLGVPDQDIGYFNERSEASLRFMEPDPAVTAGAAQATIDLHLCLAKLASAKDALDDPGADILGTLVAAARRGEITMQDVVNTSFVLIVAGHDTAASMVAMGTLTLLHHPQQMAELRAHPELIPGAVEELLRYLTIVHLIVVRVAKANVEIGGVTIPKGEGIVPLNLSANRDDAHFPDAASFDIHRKARDHFAFGYGMHQCVGQNLARAELTIVFERLLDRVPTLRLDAPVDDLAFKRLSPINGVAALPVAW